MGLNPFKRKPETSDDPLDQALLNWSGHPLDNFTVRDGLSGGVSVMGMTGSGKTSASGAHLALSMLNAGFGFLVCTVKGGDDSDSDVGYWRKLVRLAGREDQLVVLEPGGKWSFNPFLYLSAGPGRSADTHTMVAVLMQLVEVVERSPQGGEGEQKFWDRSLQALLRKAVDLAKFSTGGQVSLSTLYEIITQAPPDLETVNSGSSWWDNSACAYHLKQAREREKRGELTERQKADWDLAGTFFLEVWPAMSSRTRGVIVASFVNIADLLLSGEVRDLMGSEHPNLFPELAESGACIVLALPVNDFGATGQLVQVAYKTVFEAAMLRRNIDRSPRPVCVWADEAAHFCTKETTTFVRESRSKRAMTVLLSQDYSSYLASGMRREEVDSLLANLPTKIFHAQGCHVTNEYAASTVAKALVYRTSWNTQAGATEGQSQGNVGGSQAMDYEEGVTPRDFLTMRTGGPPHYVADALVVRPGKIFSTGKPYLRTTIPQIRM